MKQGIDMEFDRKLFCRFIFEIKSGRAPDANGFYIGENEDRQFEEMFSAMNRGEAVYLTIDGEIVSSMAEDGGRYIETVIVHEKVVDRFFIC